ncbi:hypothetical protein RUM43_010385 [Polyplax serrata]|uniref:SCP domain-containing protein n=1 Tax=Polyplax serrata TaxID=468196 RepID=A0AAN8PKS5_POLSC
MLSTRPFKKLSNINDTTTDWYASDFVTECLCWHNVYRQRHRSPPLTLCPELCNSAQEWANTLAHMNLFFYRPNAKHVGQNIYCKLNVKEASDVTGQEVAGYWYRACRYYNFLGEPKVLNANVNAGHFTQLVWASTSDVGIGIARTRGGKVMVVANYRPPGNTTGEFQKNVFLPVLDKMGNPCLD